MQNNILMLHINYKVKASIFMENILMLHINYKTKENTFMEIKMMYLRNISYIIHQFIFFPNK